MWQVYALLAHDVIEERNREARQLHVARHSKNEEQQLRQQRRLLLRHRFGHRA
jgi:hypothetical protein